MKKRILTVVLTALMLFGLTACGPKSIEEVEGTVYECKQFSALCPEDWSNIPVMELNDEVPSGFVILILKVHNSLKGQNEDLRVHSLL